MAKAESRKNAGSPKRSGSSPKQAALDQFRVSADGEHLTTDQGLRINDDQNSLKAGARGPSLLEDFILREKITHFDHERIPERVVHARGAGAHGYFQVCDGHMRQTLDVGPTSYHPNSLGGGCPMQAGRRLSGFVSYPEAIDAEKQRARGEKFFDHFSQATLFWNSQSPTEQGHIVQAFLFELGKVDAPTIRERMLGMLAQVDKNLAGRVSEGLGMAVPARVDSPMNMSVPADRDPKDFQPRRFKQRIDRSQALSMADTVKDTAKTRKVAILAADGVDAAAVAGMQRLLKEAGAQSTVVAPRLGALTGARGQAIPIDWSLLTVGSVLFDAVYVPGGDKSAEALTAEASAVLFVREAFKHCKAIAASGAGVRLLAAAGIMEDSPASAASPPVGGRSAPAVDDEAIVVGTDAQIESIAQGFIRAIARHRNWSREAKAQRVPA